MRGNIRAVLISAEASAGPWQEEAIRMQVWRLQQGILLGKKPFFLW